MPTTNNSIRLLFVPRALGGAVAAMAGDVAAVSGVRVVSPGPWRVSEIGLDHDIGRCGIIKMDVGPIGRAVVADDAIALVSALRVPTVSIRPDGPRKSSTIRREVVTGNTAGGVGDRIYNMTVETASSTSYTTNAIQVRTMTKSAH